MVSSVKVVKSGARVSSPRGYRAVVYPNVTAQRHVETMSRTKREATSYVRREALKLGLGARGEVYGGRKFDSVVHACRVIRNNAGHLTLATEDT